jgi:hypothetical protein
MSKGKALRKDEPCTYKKTVRIGRNEIPDSWTSIKLLMPLLLEMEEWPTMCPCLH